MRPQDPQALFRKQVAQALVGVLVFPILMLAGFLIFLFALSYTHFLGGPYGIARLFFWFLAFVYGSVGYGLVKLSQSGQKKKNVPEERDSSGRVYRDAEIVDK